MFNNFYIYYASYLLSIQDKKEDYVASFKGSEFSLKDMNNNLITESSFEGPLTAIFFGFTHCPDVCPMTLNKMDLVLNKLKNKNKYVKLFFISVDPERDTPEVIKNYLNSFDNKLYRYYWRSRKNIFTFPILGS